MNRSQFTMELGEVVGTVILVLVILFGVAMMVASEPMATLILGG